MALTATTSMARRIDRAEQTLVRGMADAFRASGADDVRTWLIGGGAAVLGEPGSPFNKVIGVGFEAPAADSAWGAMERAHAERRARVQVELSTLADPSTAETLTGRGYRLVGFENVLARRLDADVEPPAGLVEVSPLQPGEAGLWTDALTTGFQHPDVFDGPVAHESFDTATLQRTYEIFGTVPGVVRLLARLDGAVAGGASLYIRDGVAVLCGAATLPAFRRRGVQSTLLGARLAYARDEGCDLAAVTTQPGSKSQENVQRAGFDLAYSRAILVLDPNRAARASSG